LARPQDFLAGCVYKVKDEHVRFPDDENRQLHREKRSVIVVSDQNGTHGTNSWPPDLWPSVWVVPLSTSKKDKTVFDVEIPLGEGGMNKSAWARVPALQIIDKDHLVDMSGQVSLEILDQVTAMILDYLGIIQPAESTSTEESEFDNMPF
jgi:mRNA-degrading endonuclease toxin of MazEF toxin-antitoxin module